MKSLLPRINTDIGLMVTCTQDQPEPQLNQICYADDRGFTVVELIRSDLSSCVKDSGSDAFLDEAVRNRDEILYWSVVAAKYHSSLAHHTANCYLRPTGRNAVRSADRFKCFRCFCPTQCRPDPTRHNRLCTFLPEPCTLDPTRMSHRSFRVQSQEPHIIAGCLKMSLRIIGCSPEEELRAYRANDNIFRPHG